MEQIVTLTLNPAIDKTTTIKGLVPDKKLRCTKATYEPGGGGVNVSRAIHRMGGSSTALFLSGGHSGKFYEQLVFESGIHFHAFPIQHHTRENITITDEVTELQYRFCMESPIVTQAEWEPLLQILATNKGYEYVVLSGSSPLGVPPEFFQELAYTVQQKDARLIVDTSEEALTHALKQGVYMIKPNLGELSTLCGVEELLPNEITPAARTLINNGSCTVVVVSMAASGAMLITAEEEHYVMAPAVKRRSTVGAGDSMVAGMVMAMNSKESWENVLKMGVSAGTAATMNKGTELCKKQDVETLFSELLTKE